jgi:hypothetical protein
VFGVTIDPPERNAAMVEKLRLPFPLLSDPDREAAIGPLGVADPTDEREIARPATIVLAPGGDEAFRPDSRDFADRASEDEVIDAVRDLDLDPVEPAPVEPGRAEPGPKAFPLEALPPYLRGAKFAATALASRSEAVRPEAGTYLEQIERYIEAVNALRRRLADERPD